MAFTHIFPGAVRTGLLYGSSDWRLRMLSPLTALLGRVVGVSGDDCAEYMWKGVYAGKSGWFRRGQYGEEVKSKSAQYPVGAQTQLWDHTLKATS